jgi:hypothetical protein
MIEQPEEVNSGEGDSNGGQPLALHAAICYDPEVGDRFHKPAGTCRMATGNVEATPERNAEVTMMSPGHVVCVIDGLEYTLERGAFVHLAEKTLKNGARLIRHNA